MGPAKGSRIATKITGKAYKDEQHHEDPSPSSKAKLKVGTTMGSKSSDMVEALYNVHQTFLSLPEREDTAMGFIALTAGHHNVLDEFPNHKESHRTVRTSRTHKTMEKPHNRKRKNHLTQATPIM